VLKFKPRPVWRPCQLAVAALTPAVLALAPMLAGQQGPNPAAASALGTRAAASPPPADYLISRDDLLDISVFDVPEMSRLYRVRPEGSITLPLMTDPIACAGVSPDQLAAAISERLKAAGLVSDPRVTVEIRESRLHSIAVTGAVKKPQIYPVFGETTLLDVLAQAEGLAEDAGGIALVTRGSIGAQATNGSAFESSDSSPSAHSYVPADPMVVDLKRLMHTGDPRLNVDLYPGDRVTVERAGVVYVVGAVNRPGGFVLTSEHAPMTVLKALALAEDLKPTALANKAMIIRPKSSASGAQEESPVKLKDILSGHAPDRPLVADEILFVPDSTSQRALRRAAEAAVQITTGVIIWRL
jgi:polysaccharide biosynthesis/export protein